MVQGKSLSERLFHVFNFLLMALLIFVSIYPLYYAVINSLNDGQNTTNFGMVLLWPRQFTLESWKTVLRDPVVLNAIWITASRTVLVTVASTLLTTMFAYAFSRPYLRGKKFYGVLGFASMYLSGGLIASFLVISWLGLYNTYWVYIIPSLFGGFYNVIIYSSNFKSIPDALFESAKMDGASEYRIYGSIVLPLSMPVITALGLFTVVAVWNDYSATLYYTAGDDKLMTLQYYILQIIRNKSASDAMKNTSAAVSGEVYKLLKSANGPVSTKTLELAAMVIAAIPMVVMYPFAQRFFEKGMLVGGVKE